MKIDALVIGEALIDIVEVEVDGGAAVEHIGGSPANVAMGLARLGHSAQLLTRIGADRRGERLREHFARERVGVHPRSLHDGATSTARATVSASGSAAYEFDIDWRVEPLRVAGVRLVHVGSLGLFLEPGGTGVMNLLRGLPRETIVTVDPNIRPSLLADHTTTVARFEQAVAFASLVKLSDEDADWLYPRLRPADVIARLLAEHPYLEVVVVTRGQDGAVAGSRAGVAAVPAVDVDVVDTISAGDTFMASLISSLLERGVARVGRDLRATLKQAARAAAFAVSAAGANPPRRDDLRTSG